MWYLVFESHFLNTDANFQTVPLFGILEVSVHIVTPLITYHSKILDGWEEVPLYSERRENCEREYEKGEPACPLQAFSWALSTLERKHIEDKNWNWFKEIGFLKTIHAWYCLEVFVNT